MTNLSILCIVSLVVLHITSAADPPNRRPVIGIVAEDYYGTIPGKSSYIAASYVKWIESAGGRVLPIAINRTSEYYDEVLSLVNGVVFPGGAVHIDKDTGYGISGDLIYQKILQLNKVTYLPVWGTCLGMELMLYSHLKRVDPRSRCSCQDIALTLQLSDHRGRLFGEAPEDILNKLSTEQVNIHYHSYCVTPESFIEHQLDKDFEALGFSHDSNKLQFVSVLEHKSLPVYMTQFHPEKNQFEWVNDTKHHNIPHTEASIAVGQYFAQFFVNECRLNKARFPENLNDKLIHSYPVTYTASNSIYTQSYLFD